MGKETDIKIIQLFDRYSNLYQPYIPPLIESLKKQHGFNVSVHAFQGANDEDVVVFPSYYKRKFKEKLYGLIHNGHPKLQYPEIYFLQKKIDIVHIQHSYLFPKVLGLLTLPPSQRPKIIITLRGGDTYVKPWIQKRWIDFYKDYGSKVDAFITMSEHQKNYLHTKWGVDKSKIHVIPISFGSKFKSIPKKPGTSKIKIVSVFRMCWEKNIDGNLRVIKYIKEAGIPVQYDIYGDGKEMGQFLYLVDKYNLTDCVKSMGAEQNNVLREKLRTYDFILQLSTSESLGMSVIEAQTLGLPAVVSDSGGLPEIVVNYETGIVTGTHDGILAAQQIIELWNDTERYYRFSENAIAKAQEGFYLELEVKKISKLYKRLLQE